MSVRDPVPYATHATYGGYEDHGPSRCLRCARLEDDSRIASRLLRVKELPSQQPTNNPHAWRQRMSEMAIYPEDGANRLLSALPAAEQQRLDREYGSDIAMTQEHVAQALGVRREGVTTAAVKLQAAGLIRSTCGHISVLDRRRLAHRNCECYATVSKEYDRLLPDIPTTRPFPMGTGAQAGRAGRDEPRGRDCRGLAAA